MIRIVLVDDHPVVRGGLCRLLEQDRDVRVVAEAGDADSGYEAFVIHRPDMVVTDLAMPGGGGLSLVRRILARERQAKILVFSMQDSASVIDQTMRVGAKGFLSKTSAPKCLNEAVSKILLGCRYLEPRLAEVIRNHSVFPEARRLAALSPREYEAFQLLAQGHTVKDCAAALKLSVKTIANQQTTIKEKLGIGTWPALVHLALRLGVIS